MGILRFRNNDKPIDKLAFLLKCYSKANQSNFMKYLSGLHSIEAVRQDISEKLQGRKVPLRKTIARWFEESGQENISERVKEHVSYWETQIIQSSNSNLYPSYLFCEFSSAEFSELSKVLCSVFNTNSEDLKTFYNSWRNTFDVEGYSQPQIVNRSFFIPKGKEIHELYNNALMIGSDLPSLIEINNQFLDKPTIAIIAQDPMRSQKTEQIELGTPFGFHAKDCREIHRVTKLYFRMIDVLLEKGYRVYLTDIYKIWIRQSRDKNRGIKLDPVNANRFLEILEAELRIFNPLALITWGQQSANVVRKIPLKIKYFDFPHPSGRNSNWPKLLNGSRATHDNKVKYWQSQIELWEPNWINKKETY